VSDQPAVQASYMKNLFAVLAASGRLTDLEAADPVLVREVAAASRMSWLPVALNVRMVEALTARLGEERGIALLADCVFRQFDTPLWKSFIGAALRLLGSEPGALGNWLPEAFSLVFRGCGRFSVERSGEHALTLRIDDLPATLAAQRLWLRSLATGMTPLFTLCGVSGSSRLDEVNLAARSARFVLSWKPRD